MHSVRGILLLQYHRFAELPEAASLLRRVYDTEGDYASSGWNRFEVEQ
jgi:hypothetical protein